jgi:2-C-methyl-D-erythritol 4-phosphate cytidylyltransferase
MLQWSVDALREVAAVEAIVVALPRGELGAAPPGATAVAGGAVRSQSVSAALHALSPGDPVIVHDAARPLAQPSLFERALEELQRSQADCVVAAAPVSDTIKELDPDRRTVRRTLDRRALWSVQTPQVFRRGMLERCLGEASEELLAAATDDAWLVEQAGGRVAVIQSEASNIKVTTPIDLQLAELLLLERAA